MLSEFIIVVCAMTPTGIDVDLYQKTFEAITYQEAKSACEDMIDINVLDTEYNLKYKILGGECVDREDVKR